MIVYRCDRCKKEYKTKTKIVQVRQLVRGQATLWRYDLCKRCLIKLVKWLKGGDK